MLAPLENPTAIGLRPVQAVGLPGRVHEIRQLVGPPPQILQIEHALGEPPEEARHPVLQDLASRAQPRGARQQRLAQRQQVALVAAGAVQQQQHRQPGRPGQKRWTNPRSGPSSQPSIASACGSRSGGRATSSRGPHGLVAAAEA